MPRSETANAWETTITAPMTSGSTTIELTTATDLPAVPFYVIIDPYSDSSREIIHVGGRVGTTLNTLTRNLGGSKSQDHSAGDILRLSLFAQHLEDIWNELDGLIQTHAALPDLSTDDHHPEQHSVSSHSDTTATGAELETLTDGSNADALHTHAAGAVSSVFGRSGAVVAVLSDYDASQIDNDSTVAGATVKAALDTLDGQIGGSDLYFVPWTSGDQRPAIQAALDAANSAGGGHVMLDRGIHKINTSTLTDDRGDKCGLYLHKNVHLIGQGGGNGRSGGTGTAGHNAATELMNNVTPTLSSQEYHLVSASNPTPDWRGAGIWNLHLEDDVSHCHSLLNVTGPNGFMTGWVSMAKNTRAGSFCMKVQNANNNEPTQYGRVFFCNIWANQSGFGIFGAGSTGGSPDWEMHSTQIQHVGGATPVSGSVGVYLDTNAFREFGGEIQFFDNGLHVYGENGRGKHCKFHMVHFEAYQNTGTQTRAIWVSRSPGSLLTMFPLFDGCEIANVGRYTTPIEIEANVKGTRLNNILIRDSRWLTYDDSALTNNGTETFVDGTAASVP